MNTMYPALTKLITVFKTEFSSLFIREQLGDILYSDDKEEKAVQSLIFGIIIRYKKLHNARISFKKERRGDSNKTCDFVIDDESEENMYVQHFMEVKYVNGINMNSQIITLLNQLETWEDALNVPIGFIFHDLNGEGEY